MAVTTVGIVGVGAMGLAITTGLLGSGFRVVGWRRSPLPTEFLRLGGEPAQSSADLAARSDVVLTILPTDAALQEVVSRPDGLLDGAHPQLVIAELSTLSLPIKAACRGQLAERGVPMLDCPINGMSTMVSTRTAAVLGSGEADVFERVLPVFRGFSDVVHYLGDFGAGTKMKYVSYILLAIHTLAAAESMALAQRAGLDLDLVYDVVQSGIAGSAVYQRRAPMMIRGAYLPAAGSIDTLHEGVAHVREYANAIGCPLPLTGTVHEHLVAAQEAGHGQKDTAVLFRMLLDET